MNDGILYNSHQDAEIRMEREPEELLNDLPLPNYVLIDAALWGGEIDELFKSEAVYRSLFRGSAGSELWSVAPYLVETVSDEVFVEQIKSKHPVNNRVTWLHSGLDIDDLRKHLRRYLKVKKEDGTYIYFRFYDPYVVNTAFPHLTSEQLSDFFSNIDYLKVEDSRVNESSIYKLSREGELQITTTAIE